MVTPTPGRTAEEIAEDIYIPWNTNDDQFRYECRKAIATALREYAKAEVLADQLKRKDLRDADFNTGLTQAAEIARKEHLVEGQTSVKFHPDCLQETKDQPEVALRKMHNAAVDNCVAAIESLAGRAG
jgi:hypothetical protein